MTDKGRVMAQDKSEKISRRAYEIWDAEGRPHGRHHEHWTRAEQEVGDAPDATDPHPGMIGDGTEEQNLDQPGNPKARISEEDVKAAFGGAKK